MKWKLLPFIAVLLARAALAADLPVSITSLPLASVPLNGTEVTLVVQGGITKQLVLTPANINALRRQDNLIDLSSAVQGRISLGLGTAATGNTGASGHTIPFLDIANVWGAGQTFSVPVAVPSGGTGLSVGTSGGIPCFTSTTTMASSALLGANLPMFGSGAGVCPTVGTRSGNTTKVATVSGSTPNGNIAKWDASGNLIDGGAGGSGTVTSVTCGNGLSGGTITTTGTCAATFVQRVCTYYATFGTTTALVPFDDTIPQIGEGTEVTTVTIVPKSGSNTLHFYAEGMFGNSLLGNGVVISVFRDATANALASSASINPATGGVFTLGVKGSTSATSTSSSTFRLRAGGQSASTTSWNGAPGGRSFGGVSSIAFCVEELA